MPFKSLDIPGSGHMFPDRAFDNWPHSAKFGRPPARMVWHSRNATTENTNAQARRPPARGPTPWPLPPSGGAAHWRARAQIGAESKVKRRELPLFYPGRIQDSRSDRMRGLLTYLSFCLSIYLSICLPERARALRAHPRGAGACDGPLRPRAFQGLAAPDGRDGWVERHICNKTNSR